MKGVNRPTRSRETEIPRLQVVTIVFPSIPLYLAVGLTMQMEMEIEIVITARIVTHVRAYINDSYTF